MKTGSVWGRYVVPRCLPSGSRCLARPAPAPTRAPSSSTTCTPSEKAEIVFKRNGRYDSSGLRQLNQFLRDWRRNEPTKMDPRLFDLIWQAYRTSGSNDYIHVVCGYRSPQTNSMLRSRSKGVAKKSQHMLGKAMDFYIPDVKLKRLREIGLKMQGGGVGYYPTSGSPFVHMDVGNVRHWPKMSRRELIAVFPDGKTLHVPSDGKPLPGFDQALASYKARKKSGNVAIASLEQEQQRLVAFGRPACRVLRRRRWRRRRGRQQRRERRLGRRRRRGCAAPQPKATAKATAKATTKIDNKIRIMPPELANPVDLPPPRQETIVAALPDRDVPLPLAAPRPQVDVGAVEQSSGGLYAAADQPPADGEPQPNRTVALNMPLPMPRPGNAPPPELDAKSQDRRPQSYWRQPAPKAPATWTCRCPPDGRGRTRSRRLLPRRPTKKSRARAKTPIPSRGVRSAASANDAFPASPEAIFAEAPAAARRCSAMPKRRAPRSSSVRRGPIRSRRSAPGSGRRPRAPASAKDTKRDAKPKVIAAQPQAARWALDSSSVLANNAKGPKVVNNLVAHSLVRKAPSEVYTAGFQQGPRWPTPAALPARP